MMSARRARSPSASLDDEQLVRALADGSLDELGVLFDRHHADVRRYLTRLGSSRDEVDDVVQATFLEVMRAAPRFDPARASARSWLFGIATIMRRRQRRSVATALAKAAAWMGLARRAPPTPADIYETDEDVRRLRDALARMAEKKREAFVLVTVEGFSGEEAARALGIPVKTIWTRLHHARIELHRAFEEENDA